MSFKHTHTQLPDYMSDVFFETGTYQGDTSREAKDLNFPRVITIELQPHLYEKSKTMSAGYDIEFHLGDSPTIMKSILPDIDGQITFWLDAHIDGGNYVPGVTPNIRQCPLYEELQIIKSLKRNDHIILIDDMRIIGKVGWGIGTAIDILVQMIKEINPLYEIEFIEGDGGLDDILTARIKK